MIITTARIAAGSITAARIADGAIRNWIELEEAALNGPITGIYEVPYGLGAGHQQPCKWCGTSALQPRVKCENCGGPA